MHTGHMSRHPGILVSLQAHTASGLGIPHRFSSSAREIGYDIVGNGMAVAKDRKGSRKVWVRGFHRKVSVLAGVVRALTSVVDDEPNAMENTQDEDVGDGDLSDTDDIFLCRLSQVFTKSLRLGIEVITVGNS
ncbi:hypothetical protein MMC13_001325 [Lambiella insularis]|nr:hypothetical protein [Lambiella insularis]